MNAHLASLSGRLAAATRPVLRRYRASGADWPWGDPLAAHGLAMEGYFWRVTDVRAGTSLIALIGVNRPRTGEPWATVGLADWPGGFLRTAALPQAWADPDTLGASSGTAFVADQRRVRVDLGPECRLDLEISDPVVWPAAPFGGSSYFQSVPGLNQYWHPWLLGGTVSGEAQLDGRTLSFEDAHIYGEKNWGKGGFPGHWWWGQAQGFAERGACVAFAGGEVSAGPLRTTVTGLVVRLPDARILRLGNPLTSPVDAAVSDDSWVLEGRALRGLGTGWTVRVEATAPLQHAHVLPVPLPEERRNIAGALEHLGGSLHVEVRHRGRAVWEGTSPLAGLEHGGLDRARAELLDRGHSATVVDAPPVTEKPPLDPPQMAAFELD